MVPLHVLLDGKNVAFLLKAQHLFKDMNMLSSDFFFIKDKDFSFHGWYTTSFQLIQKTSTFITHIILVNFTETHSFKVGRTTGDSFVIIQYCCTSQPTIPNHLGPILLGRVFCKIFIFVIRLDLYQRHPKDNT